MLISRKLNMCLIHNPCSGTTAVKEIYKEFAEECITDVGFDSFSSRVISRKHMSAGMFALHYPECVETCMKMGIVRNPYTRFVSAYLNFLEQFPKSMEARLSFSDFVDRLDTIRITFDWMFVQFAPQWRFFMGAGYFSCVVIPEDTAPEQIAHAEEIRKGHVVVNRLFRYEFLEVEVNEMAKQLGFYPKTKLSVKPLNPSRDRTRESLIQMVMSTPEILRKVNRLYAADFLLFGYRPEAGLLGVQPVNGQERMETLLDPFWRGSYFPEGPECVTELELRTREDLKTIRIPSVTPTFMKWLFKDSTTH